MSEQIASELKERYSVHPEQIEKLKKQVIVLESEGLGIKPVNKPKLIMVGGQPGSGKSDLQKYGELALDFNAVILSTDVLRSYHPFDQEIKKNYPEYYHNLTVDLARTLLIHLENFAVELKRSFPSPSSVLARQSPPSLEYGHVNSQDRRAHV